MNLHQYDIGHIKAALTLAERGQISRQARQEIAIAKKLIARAEKAERAKHIGAYAEAIGTKPSQGLMDSIAEECRIHGSN
jgi:hypothetical protein